MVGVHSAEMNSKLDAVTGAELELLKLVRRHLETFGRGSSLYRHVERAGYLVLRTLEALGPVSTSAPARNLHLDDTTVARQITALEGGRFVEQRPGPADGRSSILVITPVGRRTMRVVEGERRRAWGPRLLVGICQL
jgi:DNA-binding MarR family transcriptional regulator